MIALIVAIDQNNAIGKDNQLLWHLPKDLSFFKNVTSGNAIIMGRKTFESIGKALPNRRNIVISTQKDLQYAGAEITSTLNAAIELVGNADCYIIGGGSIYQQSLTLVDRLYITKVAANFEADTFFPTINWDEWTLVSKEDHPADEKHAYAFSFCVYDKK
ncbi:MAG: dihydrofolate reductase [Sphingobacteriaceae bacterium]|jgi:dihydrofolate reductase